MIVIIAVDMIIFLEVQKYIIEFPLVKFQLYD
jgi:hypothetical protein